MLDVLLIVAALIGLAVLMGPMGTRGPTPAPPGPKPTPPPAPPTKKEA